MQNRPLLLGHRGARAQKEIAENTFPSFDLAVAQGCDGFEFDVRLSSDGQAVVRHNATTRGREIAESPVSRLALPLLHDVIARYQKTAFLDIELKVAGLETIVTELLHKFAPARGFVVSSFLPEVLQTLHGLDSAIPLGLICETEAQFSRWPRLPVKYVIPHHKLLRRNVISKIKDAGNKVIVWTVNSPAGMKRFADWRVDGIISDHPKRLALTLGRSIKVKSGR
ncbi:MAG: glycerophosphodiester phosphodiesterase [Candidatus Sulfotelmatobacter sp.]|jgi:glycerophosphoryl diester phosphodiesterase